MAIRTRLVILLVAVICGSVISGDRQEFSEKDGALYTRDAVIIKGKVYLS